MIDFLASRSNFAQKFGSYNPRRLGVLALTSMVKLIALMQNPRRGHDAQGKLKKIHLGWTAEGYSNFMAPMRMDRIAEQVRHISGSDKDKGIFTEDVLKPETDTYLTPSWDEMVPFPMTWKIRFDGFGKSDYGTDYARIKSPYVPDFAPPWYQPQGASHTGGSWADVACICASAGKKCFCADPSTKSQQKKDSETPVSTPKMPEPLATGCCLSQHAPHL